jgi:translin
VPLSSANQTPDDHKRRLRLIGEAAQASFAQTHDAREQALRLSRQVIRNSANSIRATHRGDFEQARRLLDTVAGLVQEIEHALETHSSVYYAGFVQDAQKEYVEATATLAFAQRTPLAGPEELKVGPAPYLNGLAESVGELRRFMLDSLRRDEVSRCEGLLELMDEVYAILVSIDFPDAVTRGLRRSTDMARGVLERTRGDLTLALRQRRLEQRLAAAQETLAEPSTGDPRTTLK